jgi:nitrite reductase/ring-hydroxylating ferredoxin subunit/uncharacterized membrane protein
LIGEARVQPFDSLDKLEKIAELDQLAKPIRAFFQQKVQPQSLRDTLHGVWLGHPLHPVLVQIPVGTWASAGILDLVPKTGPATTALIGTGLVAAGPAALTGWTDWSELNTAESRAGLVHAGANYVAMGLYAASLWNRLRGRRLKGKALAYAGLGVVSASGIIGGHLSFRRASGANHTADVPDLAPGGWTAVGRLDELPEGGLTCVEVGPVPVLLHRRGASVQAIVDKCSHLSGPLHEGELVTDGGEACVSCPWHGSTFRLRDGAVVHGPATSPQPALDTRVVGDQVEVRLRG